MFWMILIWKRTLFWRGLYIFKFVWEKANKLASILPWGPRRWAACSRRQPAPGPVWGQLKMMECPFIERKTNFLFFNQRVAVLQCRAMFSLCWNPKFSCLFLQCRTTLSLFLNHNAILCNAGQHFLALESKSICFALQGQCFLSLFTNRSLFCDAGQYFLYVFIKK